MANPNKDQNQGQQKSHEIANPATGERRTVTQQEWRENGKTLREQGFERVDDAEVPAETPPVDPTSEPTQ